MAEEKAKKLGMDRRGVPGQLDGPGDRVPGHEPGVRQPLGRGRGRDARAGGDRGEVAQGRVLHHRRADALHQRRWRSAFRNAEFIRNMGFKLKNDADAYALPQLVKEMFFDSETSMVVISGVPGKEINARRRRQGAGRAARTPGVAGKVLPSWLMSQRKKEINDLAGCQRALCQGNCAPNHYWDTDRPTRQDKTALFEQMEREVKTYGIDSWKWYCHTDPGRSGNGFKLDDEKLTYPFYEQSKKLGLKIFSVHKGYASQSRTLGHLANPADVEKAALDHPDLTFIIYHSALKHGPGEPQFKEDGFFDPTTGDFAWHDVLMKIKERNPQMNNVYPRDRLVVRQPGDRSTR